MRVTPALRTLGIALVSGGVLAVAAAGTATAGDSRGFGHDDGEPVWGTVVSRGELNLRAHPDTGSAVLGRLSPGSQDRVACATTGSRVFGDPYWYWLVGARAWASAAFVDIGTAGVPKCSDPCEGDWKDRWHDTGNCNGCDEGSWSSTGSWTASGTWSWTFSGSWDASGSGWEWVPGRR
ncbi:SH3 domain-containing protein [Streptomyces sp. Qhu-G9]|uniref:SH3 domain-containing protein n=1 Tax=Streptomyces sp. Qhu-G9 TaxID=3452799 RepID=UPI0022AC703C|nr:SH3 domain-containing protein [Streptomyces aurantiacus]WAU78672.1 SH3 domain-containing protein [Streptomyces aurantiacus]